jgi:hypothetical protein
LLSDEFVHELENLAQAIAELVQTLKNEAECRERQGHWLESRLFYQAAAYFTQCEFEKAGQLLLWIGPDEPTHKWISSLLPEERRALVPAFVAGLSKEGVNQSTRRFLLGTYERLRSHRPHSSRPWAAQAIERRERGEKWQDIESALLPPRKDGLSPDGERIRRSAQHLMKVLDKHRISAKPEPLGKRVAGSALPDLT